MQAMYGGAVPRVFPGGPPAGAPYGHLGAPLGAAANLFSSISLPPEGPPFADGYGDGDSGADGRYPKAAVQEKNRRAQKRFRERQKAKMTDMTSQLDEMTGELGRLRLENSALKSRNAILEKVLTLRDEHIRVLQDEQQVFDLGSAFATQRAGAATKLLAAAAPGGRGAATFLELGAPGDAGAAAAELAALAPGGLVLPADVEAVKAMPAEVLIARWKEAVRALGNVLMELDGAPAGSGARGDARREARLEELQRLLDAAGQMCMQTAVLHPTNMQRLIAATLDDGRSGARHEDRARWGAVAAALQLSEEQAGQVVGLRAIYVARMARVMDVRRSVVARLRAVSIPDHMVALQAVIAETLKVNEATAALKANLQEEHLAGMEFIGTVFKTVLGPLQKARCIVQSYPFYPDVYQIASAVAAARAGGEAPAGALGAPAAAAPVAAA
jgi:hypothetical protein